MIFLTSSILSGFIRLCLIILFIFYLNKKFISVPKQPKSIKFSIDTWFKYSKTSYRPNFLDFTINNWFRFGSLILLLIFVLVQLNGYNLFNSLFILLIFVIFDIIGFNNLTKPVTYFKTHIRKRLLKFLKNIDNKKPLWQWFKLKYSKLKWDNDNLIILIITILLGAITFLSRYYFIIYDNYSLSDAWIYDLSKVIQFDSQVWFANDLTVNGEFAFVNFYSKLTNVSPEIALQAIAILESTLLAVIIYWVINKLTPSKFLAPIIASFSFSLIYILTPLNVYFLLKANPIFMALTFVLPIFVFFIKPNLLRVRKITYTLNFIIAFTAIGLIDLFTCCILIPPFLLIAIVFTKYKYKIYNLLAILAYIISIGLLYIIYAVSCYYQNVDLVEFVQSNLLSVSSYTYVPQLILSYDIIVLYVQYSTVFGAVLVLPLIIFKKENWRALFIFFLYFNFLIFLTFINNEFIDLDMIKNSLVIILPLILGFNVAIVIRIFNLVLYRLDKFKPITITLLVSGLVYAAIFYQKDIINKLKVSDQTPKQILDAYDKIDQSFLDKTYTVVNDPKTQVISTNKHFFMNYDYFLEQYKILDSIYFKNYKKRNFLKENPQYELSKSVLVFVLNDKTTNENNDFAANKVLKSALINEIIMLKKRGRKINLFYDTEFLKVYEIVNEPNETKISDIIFKT